MPTFADVAERTDLTGAQVDWLHLLVGDWQLIADLSFADLVLWLRTATGWTACAHVRPTTGVGAFAEDLVGQHLDRTRTGFVEAAWSEQRIVRSPRTMWRADVPVREESIPVVRAGETIGVITRHTNLASMRTPSRLEVTYLATADALARMIAVGDFPDASAGTGERRGAPRVGDGVMRLDAAGRVGYASPNAVSVLHRLGYDGPVVGVRVADAVAQVLPEDGALAEDVMVVLTGRTPWRTEIVGRTAHISVRSIPLAEEGHRIGAVLLVRDVTELRRREQELLTKDATIREIHHRVKNNLQTVAAVLRLQARRVEDPTARSALADAVRRVATIADVHETLSLRLDEGVDFDEVARRGIGVALELGNRAETQVTGELVGSFGRLGADDATAVAMVLAELVQNAVEHGFAVAGGHVRVRVHREPADDGDRLQVEVADDGAGLPDGFAQGRAGLGTQIVRSLVQDLRGQITWQRGDPAGTLVRFDAVLRE